MTLSPPIFDINNKRVRFGLAEPLWKTGEHDYTPHERAAISRARHLAGDLLKTVERERRAIGFVSMLASTVAAAWLTTVIPSSNARLLLQAAIIVLVPIAFLRMGLQRRFNIPQASHDALLHAALCPQCLRRLAPTANSERACCARCSLEWPAHHVRFPDAAEIAKRRPAVSRTQTVLDALTTPVPFSPAFSGGALVPDPADPVARHRSHAVEQLLRSARYRRWLLIVAVVATVAVLVVLRSVLSNPDVATIVLSMGVVVFLAYLFIWSFPRSLMHVWIESAACPCCDSQLVWCAQMDAPGRVRCPTCSSEWISQSLSAMSFARETESCPRCKYPLAGLLSSDNVSVRCPECALVLSSVRAARCGKCLEPLGLEEGSDDCSIECRHCRTTNLTHKAGPLPSPSAAPIGTGAP